MQSISFFDRLDKETESVAKTHFRNLGSEPQEFKFQLMKKDGEKISLNFVASQALGETKKTGSIFLAVLESRPDHGVELNASRGFLDSLIDNLPLMVFVKRADDLRFVRFNKVGLELLGLSSEEVIGKNDFDFFPKEQAEHFVKKDREVLRGKQIFDIPEEPIKTRHQGERILHTKKIPWLGKDGQPEYLLGISEDITERKKIELDAFKRMQFETEERERAISLERIRLLSDLSAVMNVSLDYHAAFLAMAKTLAPRFCDFCVVSIEKDQNALERVVNFHPDPESNSFLNQFKTAEVSSGIQRLLQEGTSIYLPDTSPENYCRDAQAVGFEILAKTLRVRSYLAVPIRGRERVRGALSLFKSKGSPSFTVEDRVLAEEIGRRAGLALDNALVYEEAQKALEARDVFLSVASHELKTPITSLKMNLQMAQRTLSADKPLKPEHTRQLMARADLQIDRLVRLIENLLDVSRIRLGKLELQLQKADFGEIIRGVVSDYREPLSAVGCEVRLNLTGGVIGNIDPARVEQVLINLLSNVIKYAPGKPVEVSLKREGTRACISVRDHGTGIPSSQQARLFERFSRASSSRNISGLGLGLFISKEIAEKHGGSIEVSNAPDQGAVFKVFFPLEERG